MVPPVGTMASGGLAEIEGRIALVATHLPDMGDIISADAENTADRETFAFAHDGDGHLFGCRNDVIHP